jgi:hypothetical protein
MYAYVPKLTLQMVHAHAKKLRSRFHFSFFDKKVRSVSHSGPAVWMLTLGFASSG